MLTEKELAWICNLTLLGQKKGGKNLFIGDDYTNMWHTREVIESEMATHSIS